MAVVLWLLADLVGEGLGVLVWRVLRFLYAPPLGYLLLLLTWAAAFGLWHAAIANGAGQSPLIVLGALALVALGFVGGLIVRDARRAAKRLPPVVTRVPARFGPVGRVALGLLGVLCFGVAALAWGGAGSQDWVTVGGGLVFGSGCLYGATTARLPTWLVHVLHAQREPPESAPPPAG